MSTGIPANRKVSIFEHPALCVSAEAWNLAAASNQPLSAEPIPPPTFMQKEVQEYIEPLKVPPSVQHVRETRPYIPTRRRII